MASRLSPTSVALLGLAALGGSVGFVSNAQAAAPAQVLAAYSDCIHIAWRPVSTCVEDWDSQMMRYPAPTSYLPGKKGYTQIIQGPNDGETPKLIECYTYKSFSGNPVSAALAFAIWGYRVSWFEQAGTGFIYRGSFLVPALWIREYDRQIPDYVYHEVRQGRYRLIVPPRGNLQPGTPYRITIEPLKVIVHEWLDFEDASTCIPSFSPIIPSDITFQPLVILWPKGPKWYYGLTSLLNVEGAFAEPQVTYADGMPPRSYDDRTRYYYEGDDMWRPRTRDDEVFRTDLFLRNTYWWFGKPGSKGGPTGGTEWYPVCGVRGYVKRGGDWESFGAQGARVMCEIAVSTKPVPFEVVRTSPENGQRGVNLNVTLEITFSKPLTNVRANELRWTDTSGKKMEFDTQVDGARLLMRPRSPLSQNTDYRITIPRGSVSGGGATLAEDFSFSFSTKPASGGGGGGGPGGPHHE